MLRAELQCIYDEICSMVHTPYSKVRFTDVLRTWQRQAELYAKGRTEPGPKVTWAKPGDSYHNYGLAGDIAFLIDKDRNGTFETASWDTIADWNQDQVADWLEVVRIFNAYGWQWGFINSRGKRYDLPHFQKTFGFSIPQLKKLKTDAEGYPILLL